MVVEKNLVSKKYINDMCQSKAVLLGSRTDPYFWLDTRVDSDGVIKEAVNSKQEFEIIMNQLLLLFCYLSGDDTYFFRQCVTKFFQLAAIAKKGLRTILINKYALKYFLKHECAANTKALFLAKSNGRF